MCSHFHILCAFIEMPLFSFSQTLHFHIHRRVKYFLSFLPSPFWFKMGVFVPTEEWMRETKWWMAEWLMEDVIQNGLKDPKRKRKRKGEGEGKERVLLHIREKIKYLQKFLLV